MKKQTARFARNEWLVKQSGISGIYVIRNRQSGRCYVGSAVDVGRRWRLHISAFGRKRGNKELQTDWDLLGPTAFDFQVVEQVWGLVDDDGLLVLEQLWWERENSKQECYNKRPTSRGRQPGPGQYRQTPEHRKALSNAITDGFRSVVGVASDGSPTFIVGFMSEDEANLVANDSSPTFVSALRGDK